MEFYLDHLIDPKGWLELEPHRIDTVYYVEFRNKWLGANTNKRVS